MWKTYQYKLLLTRDQRREIDAYRSYAYITNDHKSKRAEDRIGPVEAEILKKRISVGAHVDMGKNDDSLDSTRLSLSLVARGSSTTATHGAFGG